MKTPIQWDVDIATASGTIYSAPIPHDIEMQMREASKNAESRRSPFLRLLFGSASSESK